MKTVTKKQLFDGKFEIQGEIAKGQTGTIYYGYDIGLRQEVAIKVYHSHMNGRLIRGKTFIEKSKPLLGIDHPNLIKIFKVEEEEDTPVIFMEFFDAPSLEHIIHEKKPLTFPDMLVLAREITEVLVHTHFQGIIHGTLHPGHVLVGPKGQIKVMDLGLSWILMDSVPNCDPELLRPLPYFPPEIAKGELLNVSSDLYCLGFMMYEMLTGTVPYAGLPKTSIMGKLAFDQTDPTFHFPDTVPHTICDLIRDMTRNKAQQRLQDATHVLTIINQQLAKLPADSPSEFLSSDALQSVRASSSLPTNPSQPSSESTSLAPAGQTSQVLKKTPPIRRPGASMNYRRVRRMKLLRKLGFFLGIALLIIGGIMGYSYRGWVESSVRALSPTLDTLSPPTNQSNSNPLEDTDLSIQEGDSVLEQELLLNQESQSTDKGGSLPHESTPFLEPSMEPSATDESGSENETAVAPSDDQITHQGSLQMPDKKSVVEATNPAPPLLPSTSTETSPSAQESSPQPELPGEKGIPTDEEVEQFLQSLNTSDPDLSLVAEPSSSPTP